MNSKDILRRANLSPTAGRVAVFSALRDGECLSAADIVRQLSPISHMPAATVYRALASLCESGLARRIPTEHGALYMLSGEESAAQLICSRCGKVETVDSPEVRRYNTALQKNRGGNAVLMVADCRRKECDI